MRFRHPSSSTPEPPEPETETVPEPESESESPETAPEVPEPEIPDLLPAGVAVLFLCLTTSSRGPSPTR